MYRNAGRGVAVVEFGTGGRMLATGAPFRLECVSAVETKGGLISFDCEYWSLLPSAGLSGSRDAEAFVTRAGSGDGLGPPSDARPPIIALPV